MTLISSIQAVKSCVSDVTLLFCKKCKQKIKRHAIIHCYQIQLSHIDNLKADLARHVSLEQLTIKKQTHR